MTREIKFRAKKINKNEFVFGYYLPMVYKCRHYIYLALEYLNEHLRYEIDPKTLGQYTGLNDKNGKEIYEGDIVSISGQGNYIVEDICKDFDMLVNAIVEGDLNEIVGNIYEYSKLIGGENG